MDRYTENRSVFDFETEPKVPNRSKIKNRYFRFFKPFLAIFSYFGLILAISGYLRINWKYRSLRWKIISPEPRCFATWPATHLSLSIYICFFSQWCKGCPAKYKCSCGFAGRVNGKIWAGQTKGQQENDQAWPMKSLNSLEVGQDEIEPLTAWVRSGARTHWATRNTARDDANYQLIYFIISS